MNREKTSIVLDALARILIGILIGVILSVMYVLAVGCLQLCDYRGELLAEYYYLMPAVMLMLINTFAYIKCKKTEWKLTLLVVELFILGSNVWCLASTSLLLKCAVESTIEKLYAALYYIIMSLALITPLAFCIGLIAAHIPFQGKRRHHHAQL